MSYRINAVTAQHIGDRKDQQDSLLLMASDKLADTAIAVVADGMGGKTGGRLASEQVTNTAAQLLREFGRDERASDLLHTLVDESHQVIRLLSLSEEKEPHSTVVAMLLEPTALHWIHLGDSRLYHFHQGTLEHRTADHSFIEKALATGKLTPAQAAVHPNRSMLLQALGTETVPEPTFYTYHTPQAGDSFLLCSDGLWAYFEPEEMGLILQRMSPKEAAKLLVELARDRGEGRGDNLSFIIIKLEPTA